MVPKEHREHTNRKWIQIEPYTGGQPSPSPGFPQQIHE